MKKINMFLLLAALSFSLFLSGCSSSREAGENEAGEESENSGEDTETGEDEITEPGEESENSVEDMETQYPVSIDVYGPDGTVYTQTFERAPTKVITNIPSATDLLLELGLEDTIVGILEPDNEPLEKWKSAYENLTVIAGKKTVSKEIIVGAEPDLVFGRAMPFTEDTMGTIEELNSMGIPVYTQTASNFTLEQSLENIILDIKNIGLIFNVQQKANEYADSLKEKYDTVLEKVSTIPEGDPVKVMFMVTYVDGTFNTFGANSVLQSNMLADINAVNVLEQGSGSLTGENLIALNPDVIVYITSGSNAATDPDAVDALLNDETVQSVNAIANEKIITIPYDDIMDYGARLFDTMEVLYEFIYN